jgi:Fusaric acid resistance protein-like
LREELRAAARAFLTVRPTPGAHRVALRAGISTLVPLLVVVALGHPGWTPFAAFGAFAAIYGRNSVHLSRAAMQVSAGAALTVAVAAGVAVGASPARAWLAIVVAAGVAALGAALAEAQDWHPPGAMFLVFAFGAVASAPHRLTDVPVALCVSGASVVFAVLVGNVRGLVGHGLVAHARGRRRTPRPTPPAALRPVHAVGPVGNVVAVLVAGAAATASGIGHPYWAMVAAVAPLGAPGAAHQLTRAGHRVVGTLAGLLTAGALLTLRLAPVPTVLVIAVLQVATEWLIGRNYALALLFITPMALLMGQIAAPAPAGQLLLDRGAETVIGALVGLVVVLAGIALHRPTAPGTTTAE